MKKSKFDLGSTVTFASIVILTLYVISDNNFAIYDSDLISFIQQFGLLLVVFAISFIIQIFIHELGHLLFGLISSYEFSSFRILSYLIIKKDGKLKLERYTIPGTAGQCLMKPKTKDASLSSALIFNLGGGILNIIVSLTLLIIHYKFIEGSSFSMYSRALIAAGVFAAITNLIPMKMGQITNDGYNVLQLIKDPTSLQVFNETLIVQDFITRGSTYDEVPQELLYFNEDYDYNNSLLAGSLAFYHASLVNKESYEKAYNLSEKIIADYPKMIEHYQNYFKLNLLSFDILSRDDQKDIKSRYNDFEKIIKQSPNSIDILRMQYSYHSLITKNLKLAKDFKHEYNKFIKLAPFEADVKIETQLFALTNKIIEASLIPIEEILL